VIPMETEVSPTLTGIGAIRSFSSTAVDRVDSVTLEVKQRGEQK